MSKDKIQNKRHTAHLEVVRRQERAVLISAIVIAVAVIVIVAYGLLSGTVFLQYRAVAKVNGDTIRVGEFQKMAKMQRLQLISRFSQYYQFAQMFGSSDPLNDPNFGAALSQIQQQLNSPATLGQQVIDSLIEDRLIRQESKRRGITVSAEEIDKGMQEGLGYYANGTPTPAPTATEFSLPAANPTSLAIVTITPTATAIVPTATATLDPNITPTATATLEPTATAGPTALPQPSPTPYTLEGYTAAFDKSFENIAKQTGMTLDDYRLLYESILLREKLLAEITKDLQPAEEQVWARHILVADATLAKSISDKLKAGEDFAKLAAEFSLDTSNKDKGGDLGWFSKGMMVAPFETAAFALQPGQISEPVQTDFGWHIIQVIGHEDRPLTADAFTQYKQKEFSAFLKKLREEGQVTTYDDVWNSLVPTTPALK
jgi:parvulin-like peptidyl-prolyl isomerase